MAEHKSPITWSPEALHDIDRLWNYYARVAGRATADKIIREIAKVGYALQAKPSITCNVALADWLRFARLPADRALSFPTNLA